MANTLNLGNGNWATKKDSLLAYNDENNNFKPLPFDFERASSATVVNKAGLIETVGNDIPRIDYSDDANGALKLEPQRTNLLTYSEDFSQWNNTDITLTNGQLAPDGTLNATKVSGVIGSSLMTLGNVSSTDSRSIYARTVSGTGVAKLMSYFGNTNNTFTLTEEWQRFELTSSSSTGGANFYIDFRDITDQTLSEFIIWGAQSEQGSYATSYISTQGSTVTRLADECNNGGNDQVINSTEGVLYAEISTLVNGADVRISVSDGGGTNKVEIEWDALANTIKAFMNTDGSITTSSYNQTLYLKIAVSYKLNNFKMYINGFLIDTDITASNVSGLNQLNFAKSIGGNNFYGNVKDVRLYNTALTDSELQQLTTI